MVIAVLVGMKKVGDYQEASLASTIDKNQGLAEVFGGILTESPG